MALGCALTGHPVPAPFLPKRRPIDGAIEVPQGVPPDPDPSVTMKPYVLEAPPFPKAVPITPVAAAARIERPKRRPTSERKERRRVRKQRRNR